MSPSTRRLKAEPRCIARSAWSRSWHFHRCSPTGIGISVNSPLVSLEGRANLAWVITALFGPAAKQQCRLLWPCQFHDDRELSLQVDPERGTWKCWPCNLGGDAPALVMKRNGVAFPEAVRTVTELAGIVASSVTSPSASTRNATAKAASPHAERPSGLPLADALDLVTEAARRLWEPEGAEALAYLHGRGLADETIHVARLGWTPEVWLPTRGGDRCYRVRGIVVPSFDGERLALVKIRQPEGTKPKHVEAFRDRLVIFPGLEVIALGRPLVIVEGEFVALLLGQELRDLAAVVTHGSASNRPELDLYQAMLAAPVWYVAHDADKAGDLGASGGPVLP